MIIKKLIKKVLLKLGLLNKITSKKYQDITNYLNLNDCFVYGISQIEFIDGRLMATGNDPQILIEKQNSTNSFSFEFSINHNYDDVEVFYSDKPYYFNADKSIKIGKCNGSNYEDCVVLNESFKYIRLDITSSSGLVDILNFKMSSKSDLKSKYEYLLNNIKTHKEKKKVIIVSHSMNETGAPLLAFNIAKKMKENGCDVVVISLASGFLINEYKKYNIPVFDLHQGEMSDSIANLADFENIISELSSLGFSSVITNTIVSGITVPIFKKYNFNIISLIHEMKSSIVNYNMDAGGRYINFYSDSIIFPNEIVRDEFQSIFDNCQSNMIIKPQGIYKEIHKVIPNRELFCSLYDIPSDAKIIIGSGTADFRKGIDLFINAAQLLINREGKYKYHFVWTGKFINKDYENWVKCQLERNGLSGRFHQIDFIKDSEFYQNLIECSDVFWLTSREDPYPSVMIESLQYNTPVVAFKGCGGADSLLSDGRGVLIDGFDINEFVDRTIELVHNEKIVSEQISKAKRFIKENLDFDNYINYLDKLCFDNKSKKYEYADVSVVIPNYNYQDYLTMRIDSIVNQTIKPREIIFLDDKSNDDSVKIARELLKKYKKIYNIDFKVIVNEVNNGCFRQWLKGIENAKYDYVWIAEADDYIRPNFLKKMISKLNKKDVALAYCKSCVIDENSRVVKYDYNSYLSDLHNSDKFQSSHTFKGNDFITDYLAYKNIIPNVSSVIINKKFSNGLNEVLNEYNHIGDWLSYIYLASNAKVYYEATVMNGHRRHSKSIIAKTEKSCNYVIEILKIKKYYLENYNPTDEQLNKIMISIMSLFENNMDLINNDDVRLLLSDIKNLYSNSITRKNLMIVLPDFDVGGGQTVSIRLANSFIKKYNVFVVNARENIIKNQIVNMISDQVNILKFNNNVDLLRLYNEMFDFCSVISFIWWADKLSYYAFGNTSVRRIISMHGCYENIIDNPEIDDYFDDNVTNMLETASSIVYTAEKNLRVFNEKKINVNDKLFKIDNGFVLGDYPRISKSSLGIGKDDFVFGIVARGIKEKGFEQAIKGIEYVNSQSKKKAHLILVASSEYISSLKKQYNSDYIHFVNNTTKPLEWIGYEELFDVGLLPTYFKSESLPTVIVEMLFLNKPIIATDIAEIKSMIDNGTKKCGITIPLKNGLPNQDKLNDAMLSMMNNDKLRSELADNTKYFSRRFDMDKCIESYVELIERDK